MDSKGSWLQRDRMKLKTTHISTGGFNDDQFQIPAGSVFRDYLLGNLCAAVRDGNKSWL
jgi:hypothetical protein